MKLESSKPAIFFLIMLAFIFTQCHKEEGTTTLDTPDSLGIKGDLNLSFAPRFGDQAFEPVKSYTYTGKQKVMFSKVDFYITGIKLEGNKPYESDMAGLIDLTGDADKRLISMIDIPSGNYTGITFTFGVTPILNKKSPKDFTSNNPLSFSSNYWADWDSYIFSVVQGLFDENGQGNFNAGFSILTGTDDCSEKVEINRAFTIKEGTPGALVFDVDVLSYFKQDSIYYDLVTDPLSHNPGDIDKLRKFAWGMANAIILKN